MVDKAPRNRVARWMIQTGKRFQENRRDRAGHRERGFRRPALRRSPRTTRTITRVLAWGVHTYTALGLVAAAGIAVLLVQGGPEAFRWSFILMAVATLIDSTDGTLARRVGVKQVLPGFDGRRLDDITDFLTYSFLPLMLIWRAGLLPPGQEAWLIWPLLASAYGFCQVSIKTDDGYFLGFPSLWNVVALYLYILPLTGWTAWTIIMVLGLLTFIPTRYLYPSQPGPLSRLSNVLGAVWAVALVWVLWRHPGDPMVHRVAWASILYPVYYLVASWALTVILWRKKRKRTAS